MYSIDLNKTDNQLNKIINFVNYHKLKKNSYLL